MEISLVLCLESPCLLSKWPLPCSHLPLHVACGEAGGYQPPVSTRAQISPPTLLLAWNSFVRRWHRAPCPLTSLCTFRVSTPLSTVGMQPRTNRHTHTPTHPQTDTQTCITTIHFVSSTTHAKCNEQYLSNKYNIITCNICQCHASVTVGISLDMNPFAGTPAVLLLSRGKVSNGAK